MALIYFYNFLPFAELLGLRIESRLNRKLFKLVHANVLAVISRVPFDGNSVETENYSPHINIQIEKAMGNLNIVATTGNFIIVNYL